MKIFDVVDSQQNESKNLVYEKLASFPAGAKVGRTIYHTGLNNAYTCIDETGDTTLSIKWRSATSANVVSKVFEETMSAGVVEYILPETPDSSNIVLAFINGFGVTFTLVGTVLTVTEYTPGTIKDGWKLLVVYFA